MLKNYKISVINRDRYRALLVFLWVFLAFLASGCALFQEQEEQTARELAEEVGLTERLDHRPTELSGGQMQRVAIARALANDPQVIFADEPTGNLDSTTGEQIMEVLADLNRQGKTIIMVTHEPNIAAYAGNRLHMIDGTIDRIEVSSYETN